MQQFMMTFLAMNLYFSCKLDKLINTFMQVVRKSSKLCDTSKVR